MNLKKSLEAMGYRVEHWEMPHSHGESILQVTITEHGCAQGATLYISPKASLERALKQIEQKQLAFKQAEQPTK